VKLATGRLYQLGSRTSAAKSPAHTMPRSSTPSDTRRNAVLRARAVAAAAHAGAVSSAAPAAVARPVSTARQKNTAITTAAAERPAVNYAELHGTVTNERRRATPSPNQTSRVLRAEPLVFQKSSARGGGCGTFGVVLIWIAVLFSTWAYMRLSPRFQPFRGDCAHSKFRSVLIGCVCPGGHELEPLTIFTAALKLFEERCVPCRVNTHKNGFNAEECKTCPSNSFSSAGALSCKPCPSGTVRIGSEATCRSRAPDRPSSFSQRFMTGLSAGYQGLVRGLNERLWGSDAEFHKEFEESGGLSNTAVWESLAPPSKSRCPFDGADDVWEKVRASDAFKALSTARCVKDVKKVFRRMSLEFHPDKCVRRACARGRGAAV
jgi:hypothetical protein